ncbi:MAG: hypothetical protein ACR2QM_06210 [Longimicrobiales bacterium]
MSGRRTLKRGALVAVLFGLVHVGAAEGQTSEVPEAESNKLGAPPELFPAELVANQIRAALADPRNQTHLDEAERLVASAALAEEFTPPEAEPSLEAITPLAARVEDSRDRISELATQTREALVGPSSTLLGSPWTPWVAVGLLLGLFGLSRALTKPTEHRSLRTAKKLARRGIVPGEVARRTGLSQDVIHLIRQRSKRREPREVA